MHLVITGGTGFVGRFIAAAALRAGHEVTLLARRRPASTGGAAFREWRLGEVPDLSGVDAVVHAALSHRPGRYRGGEGDDPAGFVRANRDGSLRLFDAARAAAVPAVLHLSSRAVLDGYPPGTLLTEDLAPRPSSLYGEVKAELEAALTASSSSSFSGINLRATGVYGAAFPRQQHKWSHLISELAARRPIPTRIGTEVHGEDLAQGVLLLLNSALRSRGTDGQDEHVPGPPMTPRVAHASDLILDQRDLARTVAREFGIDGLRLPPRSDATRLSVLDCTTLRRMGWQPGGRAALRRFIADLAANEHAGVPPPAA